MSVLVAVGFLLAGSYYRSVNRSYDPRVVPAKKLYSEYNGLAAINDIEGIFMLLDSIENIYNTYPHYQNSYEIGVLYNNRAAALLTLALNKDSMSISSRYFNSLSADTLFTMAQAAVEKSISIYEAWLARYENVDEEGLKSILDKDFVKGLEDYPEEIIAGFVNRRIDEIQDARIENMRRLSVSYTNLGVIYRSNEDYEMAARQYQKAIELWDRNLTAQNNLNILLGRPLEKQSLIDKMFPPEK